MSDDRNALSFWFPKLAAAGLPVPRTVLVHMTDEAESEAWQMFDGKKPGAAFERFVSALRSAGDEVGYPCFLRSDHTSAKHGWNLACFVQSPDRIGDHAFQIAYFSECNAFMGELPWRDWAVREFLPTLPLAICPHYNNMPVCREFRFFVNDGIIQCWHPYWPQESLARGGVGPNAIPALLEKLWQMDDLDMLSMLASAAGQACGGAWSVDLLETKRGWYVTDMAEALRSWHWPDCVVHAVE